MPRYKMQVQDDDAHPDVWRDISSAQGMLLTFDNEAAARAELAVQFPVLVKMESFAADRKRARVVVVNPYQDIDEEKDA